jgi:hypothetical protein
MKVIRAVFTVVLALAAAAAVHAEVEVAAYGSTGLKMEGLHGWVGPGHESERIVIRTDEAPVYVIFQWDARDFAPVLTVADSTGADSRDYDLTRGSRVTLGRPGVYVCTLSARKGTGHWFCVVISGRTWDN